MASVNIFKLFKGMNPITKSEPVIVRSKKDLKKFFKGLDKSK